MTSITSIEQQKQQVPSFDLYLPKYTLFCVTVSSLGFLCNGWITSSPNLPGKITHACENGLSHVLSSLFPDCLPMSDALWGFAVASFCVGGLVGSLTGGFLQTKFGRKKTITFNSLGFIIGSILISCATSTAMFIVGRSIVGYSCGLSSLTIPIYIGEISTIKTRGMMGALNQGMIAAGILIANLLGLPLSNVPLWRVAYAIAAVPAIVQFVAMPLCVESPRYLISINKIEEARSTLQKLRPNSNIELEFYGMLEGQFGSDAATLAYAPQRIEPAFYNEEHKSLDRVNSGNDDLGVSAQHMTQDYVMGIVTTSPQYDSDSPTRMNFIQIFKDPLIRRIAIIAILLQALQQLIGINAVIYYSTTIFDIVFHSGDMSKYMTIVTSVIGLLATLLSMVLIERAGRRTLLYVSGAGACIFSILLIIGYVYNVGVLLVVSVFAFVFSFSVGMGPIPWMVVSEITPLNASSSVGALATCVNWIMNFLIGQLFPIIFARIQGYSFAIFGVIGLFIVLFVYFFVPETKGRSLEDVVNKLRTKI